MSTYVKKRWLAALLMLLLAALLMTGCGKKDDSADGEETDAAQEETDETSEDASDGEDDADETDETDAEDGSGEEETTDSKDVGLTMKDSVSFLQSMTPQQLGLNGSSMAAYEIYPEEGGAVVDGLPCTKLQVCKKDATTNTNDIQGLYLLSRGTVRRLFRVATDNQTVVEISLPSNLAGATIESESSDSSEAADADAADSADETESTDKS